MEKMPISKMFKYTLILILAIYIGNIVYKMNNIHNSNLLIVSQKKITEAAKKCVDEDNCTKDNITLQILYDKGYLTEQSNPVSKEVYDSNSVVNYENGEYSYTIK